MAYSLEDINYRTITDPKGMIEEADALYDKKVERAARLILENKEYSPIILVSGPSGSGKTTSAIKISEALERHGVFGEGSIVSVDPEDSCYQILFDRLETPRRITFRVKLERVEALGGTETEAILTDRDSGPGSRSGEE